MVDKLFKSVFTTLDNALGLEHEKKSNQVIKNHLSKTIAGNFVRKMCIIHK